MLGWTENLITNFCPLFFHCVFFRKVSWCSISWPEKATVHVFLFMSSPNSPPYPPSVFPEVRDLSYWITLCVLLPLYYLMIFWWQTGMMDNLKVSVLIVCVYKFCCLICVKDIHHWSIINSWSVKSVKRKTYKGMKESCWGRNQYDNTTYNINKRFFKKKLTWRKYWRAHLISFLISLPICIL